MQLVVVNLLDMLARFGREEVEAFLHTFSCPLNIEVESFLRNKAIDFSLQKISVTHLVFNEKKELVAYFALSPKAESECKENHELTRIDTIFLETTKYTKHTKTLRLAESRKLKAKSKIHNTQNIRNESR